MIRLRNSPFSRVIHQPLYERMVLLSMECMPQEIAEKMACDWLTRLYNSDPSIHILINMNDTQTAIVEHAVIEVQASNTATVVVCHQCKHDKPSLSHIDEGIEYMEKLATEVNATCKMFFVSKNIKALEKKYGYTAVRTCMVKYD